MTSNDVFGREALITTIYEEQKKTPKPVKRRETPKAMVIKDMATYYRALPVALSLREHSPGQEKMGLPMAH